MTKGPGKYVVEHTMVGVHAQGEVVEFTKTHLENGHDIDRLLANGAIRKATAEESDNAVEFGTNPDITHLFPPVPADPHAAAHQEVPQPKRPDEK